MKNFFRHNALRWVLFGAYVTLTLWLTVNHELWRDEADSWLLARDGSVADIFKIMPDAGHPPLWYLLLKPLAAADLSWRWMQGVNLMAVWLATGLLIFQSGLDLLFIIPLLFSLVFSYEFPVIARNYGLGIFGLFLYAATSESGRRKRSAVLLSSNFLMCFSTVHFLALAIILFCQRGMASLSKSRWLKSEIYFLVMAGISIAILWPTGRGQFSANFFEHFTPINLQDAIVHSMLPFEPATPLTLTLSLAAIAMVMAASKKPKKITGLFTAGLGMIGAIFVFKYYSGAPRHSGLLLVWLCACVWMTDSQQPTDGFPGTRRRWLAPIAMWLICAWNLPVVANVWQLEATRNFSDAHEAAEILNGESMKNRPVVCWVPRNCLAILPYLEGRRKFWYPEINREGTFEYWDAQSNTVHYKAFERSITIDQVIASTIPKFSNWGKQDGPLFVSNWRVPDPDKYGLKLISLAKKSAWRILDESFWVYGPQEMETP